MRILFLTQYFPPEMGAAQLRLAACIRELRKLGHEVEVVTALPNHPNGAIFPEYRGRFAVTETWEGVTVHRVWLYASLGRSWKRLLNYFSFMATAWWGLLKAERPDLLFVESPPLFLSVTAWLYGLLFRVPFLFNVADLWPDSVKKLGLMSDGFMLRAAERLEAWSYRKAELVNAVTEGIQSVLTEEKGVPAAKVLWLPNGVDTELYDLQAPDPALAAELGLEGKAVVLYAGTMGYAHGVEVALEAAPLVAEEGIHLLFVGEGSEKAMLLEKARGLANVTFLPAQTPERVAQLYGLCYAGLSTLRDSPLFEGTRPVKIFACMACRKPVAYCGKGEGARLVEAQGAGLTCPPEDPRALADVLLRLKREPEAAQAMGARGRAFVCRDLSWSGLVKAWSAELFTRLEA